METISENPRDVVPVDDPENESPLRAEYVPQCRCRHPKGRPNSARLFQQPHRFYVIDRACVILSLSRNRARTYCEHMADVNPSLLVQAGRNPASRWIPGQPTDHG